MVVFEELISRLEGLKKSMPRLVDETAKDPEIDSYITELNLDQMYSGIDSDGYPIEPEYKPYTIKQKIKLGQPIDRVTLYSKGNFYRGHENIYSGNGITLTSSDSKTKELTEKYSAERFGLTPKSLELVREVFFELILQKVKDKLL